VSGVWIIYGTDLYSETLMAVFPADQELEARRWADELGYTVNIKHVEFGAVTL
jgi:hypothetical protein